MAEFSRGRVNWFSGTYGFLHQIDGRETALFFHRNDGTGFYVGDDGAVKAGGTHPRLPEPDDEIVFIVGEAGDGRDKAAIWGFAFQYADMVAAAARDRAA